MFFGKNLGPRTLARAISCSQEDGKITLVSETREASYYSVLSEDGERRYPVRIDKKDPKRSSCSCHASSFGTPCKHLVACSFSR